jgi:hypothetical protein
MIRVDDRAALRAPAQRVWCALELPARLVLAPFELRLEIRHAFGDPAQRFGVGPAGVELPVKGVDLPLKPGKVGRARVQCLAEPLLELRKRVLRVLFCDPMALRLRAQLAVAIGHDGLEPGTLRGVLSRDLFERHKRRLQPIERLADLTIFGGDPLKLRFARQPGAFVDLPLLLDRTVQILQFVLGRAEQASKRLMFQLHLPDFFVLGATLAVRVAPLAGELRLEPRLLVAGPQTIGGADIQKPIPHARRFHAGPGEIPFERRPRVRFPREPFEELRLAHRRGSESGGGAVLRVPMRRHGVGQPLLHRGVAPAGILAGRFGGGQLPLQAHTSSRFLSEQGFERRLSRLKFREARPGLRQLRRVAAVRFLMRGLGGRQFPVETRAPVGFLSEQVLERCLPLVRGGKIDRGALPGVLMRSVRFRKGVGERRFSRDSFSQVGKELRFAAAEVIGRGDRVRPARLPRLLERRRCDTRFSGERVTRLSGLRQARRELRVPLRQLVGERHRL